jgi:hypothetical protein
MIKLENGDLILGSKDKFVCIDVKRCGASNFDLGIIGIEVDRINALEKELSSARKENLNLIFDSSEDFRRSLIVSFAANSCLISNTYEPAANSSIIIAQAEALIAAMGEKK